MRMTSRGMIYDSKIPSSLSDSKRVKTADSNDRKYGTPGRIFEA